ncbi:uncharacterized protein LOC141942332 isoform X3 [Strix uralensis]|uniref:uncharacterized protein LOC141942332 isoform X3 n=1 Tax=Strix uralensis TaxID=36305 RepID=UPI003DA75367
MVGPGPARRGGGAGPGRAGPGREEETGQDVELSLPGALPYPPVVDLPGRSSRRPGASRQPPPFPRSSSQMPRRKEVPALGSLCLQNLAQHMQSLWVKDYSENYLDEYQFRFVMGPFNDLAGSLVQELIRLLGESRRLTRAALHLLLLPHLRELSLRPCPGLASNAIGQLIALRCKATAGRRRGRRGFPLAGGAGAAAGGWRGGPPAHPAAAAGGGGGGAGAGRCPCRLSVGRGGRCVAGGRRGRGGWPGAAGLGPPGPADAGLHWAARPGAGRGAAAGAEPGPPPADAGPARLLLPGRALAGRPACRLPRPAGLQRRAARPAARRCRRREPGRAAPLGHRPAAPQPPPAPQLLPRPGQHHQRLPGPARAGAARHAGLAAVPCPTPADPPPARCPLPAGLGFRDGAGGAGAAAVGAAGALAGREPRVQPDCVAAAGLRGPPAPPGPVPLPGRPPPRLRRLPAGRAEAAPGPGHHLGVAGAGCAELFNKGVTRRPAEPSVPPSRRLAWHSPAPFGPREHGRCWLSAVGRP